MGQRPLVEVERRAVVSGRRPAAEQEIERLSTALLHPAHEEGGVLAAAERVATDRGAVLVKAIASHLDPGPGRVLL